jgi:carbamoyl-phosphate synthase small subunit
MTAILALEDGRVFRGEAFGATGTKTGEVCFNTSLSGYQEVLTDPSYFGQIVAMTNPHIGNYGINVVDEEAHGPQVRGFVIEELSEVASNWRSEETLHEYLRRHGIPGIQEVDTRALTKHLRQAGAMKACLTTEKMSEQDVVQRAVKGGGVVGMVVVAKEGKVGSGGEAEGAGDVFMELLEELWWDLFRNWSSNGFDSLARVTKHSQTCF